MADSLKDLKEEARLRSEITTSVEGYLEGLKSIKTYQKTINDNEKYLVELRKLEATATGDVKIKLTEQIKLLEDSNDEYEKTLKLLKSAVKEANTLSMVLSKGLAGGIKSLANLPAIMDKSFGKLKSFGLFEMEKSIKTSGLQMGILSKQSDGFRSNIVNAAKQTSFIGVGIKELSELQASYSEEIGRSVILSQEGLKNMAAMSVATSLGAEGTAQMVADMDAQGLSAERTGDFMNKTLNSSHKMGLNASKVVKNIQGNIKMLNRYNFKDGVKGLGKMAELVTKMGVDMEFAAGFADKLWDIEGAVDMSAQLQVMGGQWAKMADPFHLMYMARNDMAGLTEEIGNAAAASMHFAKDGSIEMNSVEMSRLKIIAKETGMDYDKLVESGKKLAKLGKIKSQLGVSVADDATKEFIANTAEYGKDGKATIMIGVGKQVPKLVSQLNATDIGILNQQMAEKKSMEERAKASLTFDEALTNTFNGMKIALLPIVKIMNDKLVPKLEDFVKDWENNKWGEKIEKLATVVGSMITTLAGWIIDNPVETAMAVGAAYLWEKAAWIANGLALAGGFKLGTKGFGGTNIPPASSPWNPGQVGPAATGGRFGGMGMGPKTAVGLGIGGAAIGMGVDAMTDPGSNWNIAGKALAGGMQGAALGSMLGPWGTAGGAIIGALYGGMSAAMQKQAQTPSVPVQPNANDTYSSGTGAGHNGYNQNRAILGPNGITPIPNGESFVSMKKGGGIENALNQKANIPSEIKHTFEPIEIRGSLMINTPGNPGQGVELLKNGEFIRNITSMIHSETQRQIGGGKNKG